MAAPAGTGYEPTPAAARARLDAADPVAYARSRNHLDGAVTGLGPYITHGFLGLAEVRDHLVARHRLPPGHKLLFELAWREYFRHVWQHEGEGILESLHEGPLPPQAGARELPADLRRGCTGVPAIDRAVRQLHATGTLHNHARMWVASYTVHLRRVHWRAGADWMLGHLLDGDLASNHLSWQWVAGTASAKPYLFNADNVARYAPASWHSPGTVIDTGYDELDAIARGRAPVPASRAVQGTLDLGLPPDAEPACHRAPPGRWTAAFGRPDPSAVAGADVWLMHPWHLADPPPPAPGAPPWRVVAVLDADHHARWPWSQRRWDFVAARMAAAAPLRWSAPAAEIAQALVAARAVHGIDDPHLGATLRSAPHVALAAAPRLHPAPARRCRSFSAFWAAVGGAPARR